MAYSSNRDLATLRKKFRRVLLSGDPNTGKTTSLRTWPSPIVGIVYPKERGSSSLSMTATDGGPITALLSADLDVTKPQDWAAEWSLLRQTTIDILAGKHGQARTFFGDGIHKAYQIALASVCGGANFTGAEFDAKVYSKSHNKFWEYVGMIVDSGVEHVVLTCWSAPEQDNALDQSTDGKKNRHNKPALPGQGANLVLGEFAITLTSKLEGVGGGAQYLWQTKAGGYNWGSNMKLPAEVIEKLQIKREVPQDWTKLDAQISKALDEVYTMANPTTTNTGGI